MGVSGRDGGGRRLATCCSRGCGRGGCGRRQLLVPMMMPVDVIARLGVTRWLVVLSTPLQMPLNMLNLMQKPSMLLAQMRPLVFQLTQQFLACLVVLKVPFNHSLYTDYLAIWGAFGVGGGLFIYGFSMGCIVCIVGCILCKNQPFG